MDWISTFTEWLLIFIGVIILSVVLIWIGNFTSSQSFLLAYLLVLLFVHLENRKKINLEVFLFWENLLNYPDYPKDIKDKMLKLIEKMRKEARSVNKNSFYDKSYPLLFVIDGNRASVWSEYKKSVITPSYRVDQYGIISHKALNFLVEKLSTGLLKESEEEPKLVIRESDNGNYIEFIFVHIKLATLKYEEKEICKFPSSLLYGRINLFPGRTLRKYGFKRTDSHSPSLEFNNNYFGIEIQK